MPPKNPQPFTGESVDLYVRQLQLRARNDFATFRQLKRPTVVWGWWIEEVARQLMRFYRDLLAGRRPKLVLMAPPQHGKTITIWDFIAWIFGNHPDLRIIFASYSNPWVSRRMLICSVQSDRRSIPPYSRTHGLMHRTDNVTRA